jgi:hypothetical protein
VKPYQVVIFPDAWINIPGKGLLKVAFHASAHSGDVEAWIGADLVRGSTAMQALERLHAHLVANRKLP